MDDGGYRQNNKGFCENITFLKSINRGRKTIIEVPMHATWRSLYATCVRMRVSVCTCVRTCARESN